MNAAGQQCQTVLRASNDNTVYQPLSGPVPCMDTFRIEISNKRTRTILCVSKRHNASYAWAVALQDLVPVQQDKVPFERPLLLATDKVRFAYGSTPDQLMFECFTTRA